MMRASSSGGRTRLSFFLFGILPAGLGLALGSYLTFTDAVWLTNSSAFWPIMCIALSASMLVKRCFSPFKEAMVAISAWIITTWTWCYFPFWLTAHHVPASSAVVSHDGRVSFARDLARGPNDQVWLMSGKQGRRIVHNVEGKLSIEFDRTAISLSRQLYLDGHRWRRPLGSADQRGNGPPERRGTQTPPRADRLVRSAGLA